MPIGRILGQLGKAFLERQDVVESQRLSSGAVSNASWEECRLTGALEDAGCIDAELLAHVREPGPHVRGCWAVDVVLDKT